MVGLPARGKTYISKKLTRYLNWIGVPTKGEVFTGCWGERTSFSPQEVLQDLSPIAGGTLSHTGWEMPHFSHPFETKRHP